MILVLHYYKSIVDGVMTSLIDVFYNMRREFVGRWDVQMKIICPELYLFDVGELKCSYYYSTPIDQVKWYEYVDKNGINAIPYNHEEVDIVKRNLRQHKNELTSEIPFLRFNRNFGDFNLLYSIEQEQKKFEADIVVCSGRLIYEILMGEDIEIECKKLIVLDSLDTYKSKVGIFPDFDDLFDTMFKNSEVIQLSNPSNFRESKYEQIEYYHKFSYRRLNALKQSNRIKEEYTFNRTSKEKTRIGDFHFENMGKGIFEHLYFGKTVKYEPDGMFTKDGLWFYLNLFGIDASESQTFKIKKSRIIDKLLYKKSDYLHKGI